MSICVSTKHSSYSQVLHSAVGAEIIYSADYGENTVYVLIHSNPQKTHATVDKGVSSVDKTISKPGTTSFLSISSVLSCKVRTFQAGEHAIDEYYNLIFCNQVPGGRRGNELRPGVKTWTPETARNEEALAQSARQEEDMQVQEQAMEEDPSAFGVDENDIIPRPEVPKKRSVESAPQAAPRFNQQTKLDSYFKSTDGKLKKLKVTLVNNFETTHDKLDDLKETLVEMNDERSKLIERCEHFEHMTFKRRGALGPEESKKIKRLRVETERLQRLMDGRLTRIEDNIDRIEDKIERIEDRIERMESNQAEMNDKLDQLLARV